MECSIPEPTLCSIEAVLVAYVVLEAPYCRLPTLASEMLWSEIEPRSWTSIVIYVDLIQVAFIDYQPTPELTEEMNATSAVIFARRFQLKRASVSI